MQNGGHQEKIRRNGHVRDGRAVSHSSREWMSCVAPVYRLRAIGSDQGTGITLPDHEGPRGVLPIQHCIRQCGSRGGALWQRGRDGYAVADLEDRSQRPCAPNVPLHPPCRSTVSWHSNAAVYSPPNSLADPRFESLRMFAIDRLIADRSTTDVEMLATWRGEPGRRGDVNKASLLRVVAGTADQMEMPRALAACLHSSSPAPVLRPSLVARAPCRPVFPSSDWWLA